MHQSIAHLCCEWQEAQAQHQLTVEQHKIAAAAAANQIQELHKQTRFQELQSSHSECVNNILTQQMQQIRQEQSEQQAEATVATEQIRQLCKDKRSLISQLSTLKTRLASQKQQQELQLKEASNELSVQKQQQQHVEQQLVQQLDQASNELTEVLLTRNAAAFHLHGVATIAYIYRQFCQLALHQCIQAWARNYAAATSAQQHARSWLKTQQLQQVTYMQNCLVVIFKLQVALSCSFHPAANHVLRWARRTYQCQVQLQLQENSLQMQEALSRQSKMKHAQQRAIGLLNKKAGSIQMRFEQAQQLHSSKQHGVEVKQSQGSTVEETPMELVVLLQPCEMSPQINKLPGTAIEDTPVPQWERFLAEQQLIRSSQHATSN